MFLKLFRMNEGGPDAWRAECGGKSARGEHALDGAVADAEFASNLEVAVALLAESYDAFLHARERSEAGPRILPSARARLGRH